MDVNYYFRPLTLVIARSSRGHVVHHPKGLDSQTIWLGNISGKISSNLSVLRHGGPSIMVVLVEKRNFTKGIDMRTGADALRMESLIKNSYHGFHSQNVDYLCLYRSSNFTAKVYFFESMIQALEVVSPHDHRYDFASTVLAGRVRNVLWFETTDKAKGEKFQEFNFHTPLNGGRGFEWRREVYLRQAESTLYQKNGRYLMEHNKIHTLDHIATGTILMVWQYRDVYEKATPSHTYIRQRDKTQPTLYGLYEKFTEEQIISRLKLLDKTSPGLLKEYQLDGLLESELV